MSDLLQRSGELVAGGRVDEAVSLLEEARAHGGGPSLHVMLGYALYHAGRITDARAALAFGLERFPFDPTMQEAMARLRWMDGEGDAFADLFVAAVEQRPGDGALRFKCAELLRLAGYFDRAERLLRDGVARNPGDLAMSTALGVLLDETGRLEEAEEAFVRCIMAFPGDPILRLNVAHTLMRQGKAEAALIELRPVRRLFPQMNLAITYEAMALKQLGDPRHDWLCDYRRHVKIHDIGAPRGFSSVTEFNRALGEHLRSMMDARDHPIEQSLRGGSQTSRNLVAEQAEILRTYFTALEEPIRDYIAGIGDDREHPLVTARSGSFRLSGCWSILLRPGGFHVNHTHPAGWISSSYYVSLPPSMTDGSQEGWIKFGEPRWPIPGCKVERVVQPKEGRVVLFPSYMWHGTIPFSSGERLTAPFDVVPV